MNESSVHGAEKDALREAINAAADRHGYPWLVGVLEGAVRNGWTASRVAAFISEDRNAPSGRST